MKLTQRAYMIIFLILLQSICLVGSINYKFTNEVGIATMQFPYIMVILNNVLAIISIFVIAGILKMLKAEKKSIDKLNNSKEVIMALKAQKHDFKNHLSVIAGLIQLEKGEKALEYIYKVSDIVDSGFAISKIENIELAATLYRKCAIAENKGIIVDLQIHSGLENLQIHSIDLCKVVFNLLDNAIYELENYVIGKEKKLSITIDEDINNYRISICNSYPALPTDMYQRIFDKGYTTKQGEDHGYGLYIVEQLIKKNKGTIEITSGADFGTRFIVSFLKG